MPVLVPLLALLASTACGFADVTGARDLHDTLGRSAVGVVQRAAKPGWATDAALSRLIDPEATFSLGAGDVGRPLGVGAAGAHALAEAMHADSYRFLGWDYMDSPVEPCAKHSVTVEFVDLSRHAVSQVEFAWDNGRIVAAKGWQRTFESGPL
jgi:hypothetical protein